MWEFARTNDGVVQDWFNNVPFSIPYHLYRYTYYVPVKIVLDGGLDAYRILGYGPFCMLDEVIFTTL